MKIFHCPGMGLHYINDIARVFQDGSCQKGDSSDNCILRHTQIICEAFGLPPFWELWTTIYPQDPLDESDGLFIFSSAEPYTAFCNPYKDFGLVMQDLLQIGRGELADTIRTLAEKKVPF